MILFIVIPDLKLWYLTFLVIRINNRMIFGINLSTTFNPYQQKKTVKGKGHRSILLKEAIFTLISYITMRK
jgi:hypothetical protein